MGLSQTVPSPGSVPPNNLFPAGGMANAHTLGALVSQHRLLELSRFGLRGYDLAQHMLTQQSTVSKLLGKFKLFLFFFMVDSCFEVSVDSWDLCLCEL